MLGRKSRLQLPTTGLKRIPELRRFKSYKRLRKSGRRKQTRQSRAKKVQEIARRRQ